MGGGFGFEDEVSKITELSSPVWDFQPSNLCLLALTLLYPNLEFLSMCQPPPSALSIRKRLLISASVKLSNRSLVSARAVELPKQKKIQKIIQKL